MQFAKCDFPLFELIEERRRFLPVFTVLSPSGPREVSQAIGAFLVNILKVEKKKTNKKSIRGSNLRQITVVRSRDWRLTDCATSILPGAPASVWTFNITGFCLWKRGPIPRLCAQVGMVEENYRKTPFFLRILAYVKMRKPPLIRYTEEINNLRSGWMIIAKLCVPNSVGSLSNLFSRTCDCFRRVDMLFITSQETAFLLP